MALQSKAKIVLNECCMRLFHTVASFRWRNLPDPLGSLPGFESQVIVPGWPDRTDFIASCYGRRALSEGHASFLALCAVMDHKYD